MMLILMLMNTWNTKTNLKVILQYEQIRKAKKESE